MSDIIAIDTSFDFISETVKHVERVLTSVPDSEPVTVIFPNRRSVRFFEKKLNPVFALQVDVYSISDFFMKISTAWSDTPPLIHQEVDRIFFIQKLLKSHTPDLYERLGGNIEKTFPWCVRISTLFNEFDRECVENASSFEYVDEVVEEARHILNNLKELYRGYRSQMEEHNVSYQGDLFRRGAEKSDLPVFKCFLCGFHHLTQSEERLFRTLFAAGQCTILFHTDLMNRHPHFRPYHFFRDWIKEKSWDKVKKQIPEHPVLPDIEFYESFDTHSMIDQVLSCFQNLPEKVRKTKDPQSVGIVLPDSGALFPLIYRLQGSTLNITMGFPFEKTVFARLLDILIELGVTQTEKGYYHIPYIKLLEHPLIRLIQLGKTSLESEARSLTQEILGENMTYIHDSYLKKEQCATASFLDEHIISPFLRSRSLKATAEALKSIIRHMLTDVLMEEDYLLERRMMQLFLDRVIPMLEQSRCSDEKFSSPEIIYSIIRQLSRGLSIPFEGNPLHGIQIMGTMESRLLSFDTLFILDVNEGLLPPDLKIDPLLPSSLKKAAGIPSLSQREEMFTYQFYRLIDSAKHVKLFYQKGESGDDKKIRSRFIEQLLLEKEIDQLGTESSENHTPTTVRGAEQSLITKAPFSISLNHKAAFKKPDFYRSKLDALLSSIVSPSLLDEYMKCPASFFFNRILDIPEKAEIEESQNPRKVGSAVHHTLDESFRPYTDKVLSYGAIEKIQTDTLKKLKEKLKQECTHMSDTRFDLLHKLAVFRLKHYFSSLKKQAASSEITVIGLEQKLFVNLGDIKMFGVVDRIDRICDKKNDRECLRVLDYKTGSYAARPGQKLEDFCAGFDFDDFSKDNLEHLKNHLHSIQLPFYIYLVSQTPAFNTDFEHTESCLAMLGAGNPTNAEQVFLGSEISEKTFTDIVTYIVEHMTHSDEIAAFDSEHCRMCSYYRICPFTTHQAPSWA